MQSMEPRSKSAENVTTALTLDLFYRELTAFAQVLNDPRWPRPNEKVEAAKLEELKSNLINADQQLWNRLCPLEVSGSIRAKLGAQRTELLDDLCKTFSRHTSSVTRMLTEELDYVKKVESEPGGTPLNRCAQQLLSDSVKRVEGMKGLFHQQKEYFYRAFQKLVEDWRR